METNPVGSRVEKDVISFLPQDVIEKIIARLPFHCLFRARLLAKRWASIILSSGSFETCFQREIMANALYSSWGTYCPIYVGMKAMIGYNLVAKCWQKILSLSYLPMSETDFCSYRLGNIAGCFLSLYSTIQVNTDKLNVWVTNPLNRSWNLLHPFSLTKSSQIVLVHLECVDSHAYKVIVITADHVLVEGPDSEGFLGAQVYNSTGTCWTRYHPCPAKIDWVNIVSKWCSAYANETLYMMGQIAFCQPFLVAYNMKDEVWSRITMYSPQPCRRFWSEATLVSCGSKMMMINIRCDGGHIVTINELIQESHLACQFISSRVGDDSLNVIWRCSQLTSLQLPLRFMDSIVKIANDDRALYFFVVKDRHAICEEIDVAVFDIREQVWNRLPKSKMLPDHMSFASREMNQWGKNAFQPGLNPFMSA